VRIVGHLARLIGSARLKSKRHNNPNEHAVVEKKNSPITLYDLKLMNMLLISTNIDTKW
jgi:hypothetical protein